MFEIIDFHTHPYVPPKDNICIYKTNAGMNEKSLEEDLSSIGISAYCGSVISRGYDGFENIRKSNEYAVEIRNKTNTFCAVTRLACVYVSS